MKKIMDFFKKLFGIKTEEVKTTSVSSTPKPSFNTPVISAPASTFAAPNTTYLNGSSTKEITVSNPIATIKFTEVDYTAIPEKKEEPKKPSAKKAPVKKTTTKKPVAKKAPVKKINKKKK